MADVLACKGSKCPHPVLKGAIQPKSRALGTTLEVHADCPSFSKDIEKWCKEMGKVLVGVVDRGGVRVATIQF